MNSVTIAEAEVTTSSHDFALIISTCILQCSIYLNTLLGLMSGVSLLVASLSLMVGESLVEWEVILSVGEGERSPMTIVLACIQVVWIISKTYIITITTWSVGR